MVQFTSKARRDAKSSAVQRGRMVAIFVVPLLLLSIRVWNSPSNDVSPLLQLGGDAKESQSESKSIQSYYDESKIVRLTEGQLATAPQTVVTAYFQVKSKHPSDSYSKWMKNMLSLQDPMVIFVSPALIPEIQSLREHARNRTVIIPMELEDVPLARQYNASFWQWQLDIDNEKRIHRSYQVFWIWLSKTWWVSEAIRHDFFHSQIFVWSDMGCFRSERYNGKQMVLHPQQIPRHSMLFLAHHPTLPPPTKIFNNKYDKDLKKHFYTSGSMIAGYADTVLKFYSHFLETMQEFLDRDMFIGEDQLVLQSTCLLHPDLCAYIDYTQVKDNYYFGLRYILHYGGNYTLWYPPGNTKQQERRR